ncbi:MAG: hypothetical protein PVJ61_03330 [Dehalococcoidia bacterium]|jgi:hypothetical protein
MVARAKNKYGVRIYPPFPDSDTIIILQTIKRPGSPRYVINARKDSLNETHMSIDDAAGIAEVVQRYLRGELKQR